MIIFGSALEFDTLTSLLLFLLTASLNIWLFERDGELVLKLEAGESLNFNKLSSCSFYFPA